jgi:hypothetical protein
MVALGIKGRREREHFSRTKLHAKSAGFAALNNDGNATFCHEFPHEEVKNYSPITMKLWREDVAGECDAGHGCT